MKAILRFNFLLCQLLPTLVIWSGVTSCGQMTPKTDSKEVASTIPSGGGIFKPTKVTLHASRQPCSRVFQEISQQLPDRMAIYDLPEVWSDDLVTIDAVGEPLMSVVAQIWEQIPEHNDSGLAQFPQSTGGRGRLTHDEFIITKLSELQYTKGVRLGRKPGEDIPEDNFAVGLFAYSDPRIRVLEKPSIHFTEARDDRGNNLLGKTHESKTETKSDNPPDIHHWSFNSTLNYPQKPGKQIKLLKGYIQVAAQTEALSIKFDHLEKTPQKVTIPEMEVTLENVESSPVQKIVKLKFHPTGMTPAQFRALFLRQIPNAPPASFSYRYIYPQVVEKATEQRIVATSQVVENSATGVKTEDFCFVFRFNMPDDSGVFPTFGQLVLELPIKQAEMQVPFEYTNIPMP